MKGLGKDEYDRVKLHATVINTKLRENEQRELTPSSQSRNPKRAPYRSSFDARELTEVRQINSKLFLYFHDVDSIHDIYIIISFPLPGSFYWGNYYIFVDGANMNF